VLPANARHTVTASHVKSLFIAFSLERRRIGLAGADADHFFQIEHEDLAVADLAGVGGLLDRVDDLLEHLGLYGGLDLDLRQEIDHIFRAAVELGMALLPAKPLYLGHGDALHADAREGFAHLVQLERLDDCGYQFHSALRRADAVLV